MGRWVCARCGREFANRNQAHLCAPGCSVEECFAGRPEVQREIYDEVLEHSVRSGRCTRTSYGSGCF